MGDRLGTLGAVGFSFPLFISRLFATFRTTLAASKPQWEASLCTPFCHEAPWERLLQQPPCHSYCSLCCCAENRSRRPRAPKAKSDWHPILKMGQQDRTKVLRLQGDLWLPSPPSRGQKLYYLWQQKEQQKPYKSSFQMPTAISRWTHQFSSDHWS